MPDNEILISTRYESVGDVELQRTYDRLLNKVNQTGYAFQNLGRLLNNQFLQDIGKVTAGFDDMLRSIDAVLATAAKLPKLGAAGLIFGGATIAGQAAGQAYNQATGTTTAENAVNAMQRLQDALAKLPADQAARALESLNIQLAPLGTAERVNKINAFVDALNTVPNAAEQAGDALSRLFLGQTRDVLGERIRANFADQQQAAAKAFLNRGVNYRQNFDAALGIGQRVEGLGASLKGNQAALGMALAGIERDAQQQRLNVARSYTQDLAAIDEAYYKQRNELAAQFGVEAARAEEDHQREMRRANEDHNKRLTRLAESRDALGIADEISNYKQERSRAEEDYQIQAARRSEDFARQLKQLEQSNIEQRNARTRAFNQQIQDINEQAEIRRQYERQQTALLIQAILDEYRKAIAQLQTVSPISNAPNWNGPNNTLNTTLNFGSVSNPNQIATIVHQEMTRVMREAVRR